MTEFHRALEVVVGACTCRNPAGLKRLLDEFLLQAPTAYSVSFVVVDNDVGEEGRPVCDRAKELGLPVQYVTEPRPGIPFARNALVAAAMAGNPDYVLMIDDDEYPGEGWIDQLVSTALAAPADVVGGPVVPVVDGRLPEPLRIEDYAKQGPASLAGRAVIDSTANLLLSGDMLRSWSGVVFDDRFAQTGGSDSQFLRRTTAAGHEHAFAPGAVVYEDVPASRRSEDWLLKRHYRNGSVKARIDIYDVGLMRAALIVMPRAAALWARALVRGGQSLFRKDARLAFLAKRDSARARGMIDAFSGRLYNEYGAANYRSSKQSEQ